MSLKMGSDPRVSWSFWSSWSARIPKIRCRHGQHRLLGEGGIPFVLDCSGELLGEPDSLIELTHRQETGVA